MEGIDISLSRHHSEQDWRVVIGGRVYDHVSTETLDDLVEFALIDAQQKLIASESSDDGSEQDSVPVASD
jgi:hypothetical protein